LRELLNITIFHDEKQKRATERKTFIGRCQGKGKGL
jgi:hypothetical protein